MHVKDEDPCTTSANRTHSYSLQEAIIMNPDEVFAAEVSQEDRMYQDKKLRETTEPAYLSICLQQAFCQA